jgi:hypothetical protein
MEGRRSDEFNSQDDDERPPLPPRPSGDELLLSPSNLFPASPKAKEPLLRRKPVIPRRSSRQSLEARSYELTQMKQMGTSQLSSDHDADEGETQQPARPKAFRKTHIFFGYNLGYWRMPARHMSIFSVLFLATFLPIWYASRGFSSIQNVNGPFSFDCSGSESGWSFVGINIRYGKFQYGAAKTIDLVWNWVVGRGLQALLTFLAYRVFQDALLRVTELTPLPYELYITLALYSTKIDILWQLSKGLFRFGNWRTRAIFIWLTISTIYLAVFPRFVALNLTQTWLTLLSLMDLCSGYDAAYTADFQWSNGTFTNTDDLSNWQSNSSGVITTSTVSCCTWNINFTTNAQYNTTCYLEDEGIWPKDCDYPSLFTSTQNYTILYYWLDSEMNTTYWNEFKKNPGEIDESKWADWNFAPLNRNNFNCVTQINTYQVLHPIHIFFRTNPDKWAVGILIRVAVCSRGSEYGVALWTVDRLAGL